MDIHIIHPYTYKVKGETLVVGDIEEYSERDSMVSEFAKRALESHRILCHKMFNGDAFDNMMRECALMSDNNFEFLYDERVITLKSKPDGVPLPNEKPAEMAQDSWDRLNEIYVNTSALDSLIKQPDRVILIGGYLENCLGNFAQYYSNTHRSNGEPIFYVPELCVPNNPDEIEEYMLMLEKQNINPLSYSEIIH